MSMGFILTALLMLVALKVLTLFFRLLVELFVRLTLGLILAIGLGIVSGMVSAENGFDGTFVGTVFALLALIPCVTFVSRWRGTRQEQGVRSCGRYSLLPLGASAVPIEERLELDDAAILPEAWERTGQLAPGSHLDTAREACARFLKAASESPVADMKIIDLAVLIRKHVPGLVADTRAVLDLSDDSKSGDAVQVMLNELHALGDEARDALAAMRDRAEEQLSVRQVRLSQRRMETGTFQLDARAF